MQKIVLLILFFGMVNVSEAFWPVAEQNISIAPQIYQIKRVREGGTKQKGPLYGARALLEHQLPYTPYWAIEGSWAEGTLRGVSAAGLPLKSHMMESIAEARLGWTFGSRLTFTPFLGLGYYEGENRFIAPSAIHVQFTDTFFYSTAGFQTRYWMNMQCSLGANVRVQQMHRGKNRTSNDPGSPSRSIHMQNKIHWIFELPLETYSCLYGRVVEMGVTPFYQMRHFGGREGIDYDFLDTKYYVLGVRLTIGTQF